jgi:hypothetical protein
MRKIKLTKRNLGCIKLANPNHNPIKALTRMFETLLSDLARDLIDRPSAIIMQDATGVSYPITKLPKDNVGLKLISSEAVKARKANLVVAKDRVRKYVA